MNKIIASVLSLFMFLAPVYSKPLPVEKSKTDFKIETVTWDPAPIILTAGNLNFEGHYLMEGVPAPVPGLLISREDFNRIEFAMNEADEWCESRLVKERTLCDSKLDERDKACKDLTKDLLGERDSLLLKNKELGLRLKSEEQYSSALLWIGGAVVLSLASTLVILQVK